MKTLTIIGSSGFLGRSIIDYAFLKSLSKWKINKIVSISRKKIKLPKKGKVKIKHYARDISKFKKLPRTDYIIYAINTNNSFSDLKSIKKFVELIKNMPKKTKILFTSSGIVYNKLENKEVYKQNKIFIEKIFQTLGNYGHHVSIARLFTFIGERILDDKRYTISEFINSGLSKDKIYVKSNKIVYRSYMHSYDMVSWLIKILIHSSPECPTFDVGSDEKIKIQSLARLVGKILKKPVKFKKITDKKIENYTPNIKKAKKELKLKINYKLRPSLYSIIKQKYE